MTVVFENIPAAAMPGMVRCDTPGHGEITAAWATAKADGWRTDFMGRRRCPECVAVCLTEPQPPAGASFQNYAVLDGPRWAACCPTRAHDIPAHSMYEDYQALFAALSAHGLGGGTEPGTGTPPSAPAPSPMPAAPLALSPPLAPLAEAAGGSPPARDEDEHITGVIKALGPDPEGFWDEADARDGHTSSFPPAGQEMTP